MTTYTRRGPGQSYLKSVLSEKINSLIEHKDLNLEINPLKVRPQYPPFALEIQLIIDIFFQVYEQMIQQIDQEGKEHESLPQAVSPESAALNPDVQAIIQPRLQMLMDIADSFLDTIIGSLEMVPYGIRWICKQIRSLTRVSIVCRRSSVSQVG